MNDGETDNKYLQTIAKALAYLCIASTDLKDSSIGDKAQFLRRLGFPDRDVAALLNTSENSIRVLISLSKKSTQKKSDTRKRSEEEQ
jgi:hypothetical protein